MNYQIFTDGSYKSSINEMGVGVVWIKNGIKVLEYSKKIKGGTNNIAELLAILVALKSIKSPINSLEIISDSQYSIGVISNPKWNPKKNKELILKIKKVLDDVQKIVDSPIIFTLVKGHSGNKYNELADKLAST